MIREARADDLAALVAAYDWLFAPPGSRPRDWDSELAAERLRRWISSADAAVFVADHEGAVGWDL